ncbi:hypothetical protein [Mucilaginibacter pallidiroseus]|uniref:hypothetical protein n=1 Tax=Mucilaginibacter pallidiroseus TaxID=2599295 RepID=UPI0021BD541D|nr:hypothetical protein [Mucilaginibacter pallidiroseus]
MLCISNSFKHSNLANRYRHTRVSSPDFTASTLRYGPEEIVSLLTKAADLLTAQNIWINHDCGLKIHKWSETKAALINMAVAGKQAR